MGPILSGIVSAGGKALASGFAQNLLGGLFGSDPAEENRKAAQRHNQFLRDTTSTRAAMDNQYMDTVYPGTSPWERLGSSAAAPIQSQDAGTTREAAMLPLKIAQLNAASQQQVAETQAQTARDVAHISAGASMYGSDQTYEVGMEGNRIAALRQAADQVMQQHQQTRLADQTTLERDRLDLDTMSKFLDLLPKEKLDVGFYKAEMSQGWKQFAPLLKPDISFSERTRILSGMPDHELQQVRNFVYRMAKQIQSQDGKRLRDVAMDNAPFLAKTVPGFNHVQSLMDFVKGF